MRVRCEQVVYVVVCAFEGRAPHLATRHSGEPACFIAHRQHREIARALQLVFYASLLSPNPTAALNLISYRPNLFRSRFSPHSPQWRPPLLPQWRVSCAPLHQTSTCTLCTGSSWMRVTLFVRLCPWFLYRPHALLAGCGWHCQRSGTVHRPLDRLAHGRLFASGALRPGDVPPSP